MCRVLGITGLIGSGKSTVSKIVESCGYILLDADQIVRIAQRKGNELYYATINLFSDYNVLNDDGELNRKLIREIILENNDLNVSLKKISHKYVYDYMNKEINENEGKNYVLDVPLLFESKIDELCDKVMLVKCSESVLIERLKIRNTMSIEDALAFRNFQIRRLDYSRIDIVINNDGTYDELVDKVKSKLNIVKNKNINIYR